MSLATRCTACGTAFRVVQDQLKVSEGWVRCGRCDAVFNALEGLFDLGHNELHDQPPATEPNTFHAPSVDQSAEPDDSADSAPADLLGPEAANALESQRAADGAERTTSEGEGPAGPDTPTPPADAQSPTPEFLRQPRSDSRQNFHRSQFAAWTAGTVLVLVLTAQAVHHFRDSIATHWASAKPALVAWCKITGCTVGIFRSIADVAVESSALTRAGGQDAFSLAVVLRNHGLKAVAMPSLELSLTDPNGQLLSRRALDPGDFHGALAIAPGAEAALQITLASDSPRTVGYVVEIFYP